jgi:dihydrolipoamide dehydrogenase
MDGEVQKAFQRLLKNGLEFVMGAVQSVDTKNNKATVTYKLRSDDSERTMDADTVLVATGPPVHRRLGSGRTGCRDIRAWTDQDRRPLPDQRGHLRAGDCIDGPMLAHKAEDEGMACAEGLAGRNRMLTMV